MYQGKKRKPYGKPANHARAANTLRSISNRPKHINDRSDFGHWEIDTVKSAAATSSCCLLTMTERKTGYQIIRKLQDGKTSSVVMALDELEKQFAPRVYKKIFKSITVDNGTEFSDCVSIEQSVYGSKKRFDVYMLIRIEPASGERMKIITALSAASCQRALIFV